jgi:hypothetical protein
MLPARAWSLWIDIEGFSSIYNSDQTHALVSLGRVMEAIYKIGSRAYSSYPNRLFAHQFGDGFVVISDFPEDDPDRPIAIAIAIMRHALAAGGACKAAVSCGTTSDVVGCYPKVIRDNVKDGRIDVGDGLMTINPVLGTALVASVGLSRRRHGAVLLVDADKFLRMSQGLISILDPLTIDWIHSEFPLARELAKKAGLTYLEPEACEDALKSYIGTRGKTASRDWIAETILANGL